MEFRVLGSVGIAVGGRLVSLGGVKPRLALALLLVHRNSVVSVDRLVDVLWGDEPAPPSAVPTLQSHLSRLRRQIDLGASSTPASAARLATSAPGYVLEVSDDLVDAGRFEQQLRQAQTLAGDPVAACCAFEEALGLWRGPALAEFASMDFARPEAARLEELRLAAVEGRIAARLTAGQHQVVIGELEALVAEHPLRERAWGHLMVAQHRSGRSAEALRTAQQLRQHLRDELGLEPSAWLRQLETDILTQAPGLAGPDPCGPSHSAEARTAASGAARVGGDGGREPNVNAGMADAGPRQLLPVEVTSLIGRERDLGRLRELLEASRLVTLVGPGGVGKTRLATRLAHDVLDRFADGGRIVELGAVVDADGVAATVAAALDVQQGPERSLQDSIVELLASRHVLLVLDNCEHVLGPVSELVDRVLRWCPAVRVLATSRESLGLPAEVVWSVPPLPVPPTSDASLESVAAAGAVELFLARARAARPDFALDEATKGAVAEVCIRLDGVPLALELAAARMQSMDARDLADRLGARFRLLAAPRRVADPRHRTLHDVVAWSYELAAPAERALFDRLSVFAGGFQLEQAEQVCAGDGIERADVGGLLANLVDKSMVAASRSARKLRYHLLETLREFGRERLEAAGELADLVRARHRAAYLELVERVEVGVFGPDEGVWLERLDLEFDNVRQAHVTAVADGDVDVALRLVAAGHEHGFRRIRYEIVAWAEASVALPGAEDHARYPIALGVVAYGQFVRGELDVAIATGQRAIDAARRIGVGTDGLAERAIANAYHYRGAPADSYSWTDRMVDAARASGTLGRVAHALYMQSFSLTARGDLEGGRAAADEALAAARACASPTALAQATFADGIASEQTGPEARAGQAPPERGPGQRGRQPLAARLRPHRDPPAERPAG